MAILFVDKKVLDHYRSYFESIDFVPAIVTSDIWMIRIESEKFGFNEHVILNRDCEGKEYISSKMNYRKERESIKR
jgi:hypothetical protein